MRKLRVIFTFNVQVLITVMTFLGSSAMSEVVHPQLGLTPYKGPQLEGDFVSPNEAFDALYLPEMKGLKGGAVTTGTFRVFQKVLYGNFDWMFVVDINPRVAEFNTLNANAILTSTRREYLENFPPAYYSLYGKFPRGYDIGSDSYVDHKPRPLYEFLSYEERILATPEGAIRDGRPQDVDFINQLYYITDSGYSQMQRKLRSTKMVFLTNTMTSREVAQKITAFLNDQETEITLLDMSNIMDYVIQDRGASEQIAAFIRALPLAKQAKLFFTISLDRPTYQRLLGPESVGRNIDTFRYYVTTPERFLELVEDKPAFSGEAPKLLTSEDCNLRMKKRK